MNNYKILCDIGSDISFIIGGKSVAAKFSDLQIEDNINRIYRVQFKHAPKSAELSHAVELIRKRPEITLRFYGDYSEDLVDWDKLAGIKRLSIDLWHIKSLKEIGKLKSLRGLTITKNITSKVSLSILEPLEGLENLYTSISKDVDAISVLKNLSTLSLREIKNDNLDFLNNLNCLETLYLSLGSFRNFDGLAKLSCLNKIDIHQVRGFHDDIAEDVLALCKNLEALRFDNLKNITNLNFIKHLSRLKWLSFEGVQNLNTYMPISENKSIESFSGYHCRPSDKTLFGLKGLKNIALGDAYSKTEVERFLSISDVTNLTIRGKTFRGSRQTDNPFFQQL